jgi:hypothetical protein
MRRGDTPSAGRLPRPPLILRDAERWLKVAAQVAPSAGANRAEGGTEGYLPCVPGLSLLYWLPKMQLFRGETLRRELHGRGSLLRFCGAPQD